MTEVFITGFAGLTDFLSYHSRDLVLNCLKVLLSHERMNITGVKGMHEQEFQNVRIFYPIIPAILFSTATQPYECMNSPVPPA